MPKVKQVNKNSFKYGMPLFGCAWDEKNCIYVCGGGGGTASGIKNRLVVAKYKDGELTDQIAQYDFGKECPTQMAVTANCESFVFSLTAPGLRCVDVSISAESGDIQLENGQGSSGITIEGEVQRIAFSPSNRYLATACTNGMLSVWDWHSQLLKIELSGRKEGAADAVRDLQFSNAPKDNILAVVLEGGTLELWNWQDGAKMCQVAHASGEKFKSDNHLLMRSGNKVMLHKLPKALIGMRFASCCFPPPSSPEASTLEPFHSLSTIMNGKSGCCVANWQPGTSLGTLALQNHALVSQNPGTCLAASRDGKLLALGTSEGGVVVLQATTLVRVMSVANAHMVFTTAITFSPSSREVLSASAAASATVTEVVEVGQGTRLHIKTLLLLLTLLLVLVAIVFSFVQHPIITSMQSQFGKGSLSYASSSEL